MINFKPILIIIILTYGLKELIDEIKSVIVDYGGSEGANMLQSQVSPTVNMEGVRKLTCSILRLV